MLLAIAFVGKHYPAAASAAVVFVPVLTTDLWAKKDPFSLLELFRRFSSIFLVFSFSGFRGPFVFSFICHFARTRAGVALSRVGLSPASAAAMVRGEKAAAIWDALRVGDELSGLVLIGWRLVPKEEPPI